MNITSEEIIRQHRENYEKNKHKVITKSTVKTKSITVPKVENTNNYFNKTFDDSEGINTISEHDISDINLTSLLYPSFMIERRIDPANIVSITRLRDNYTSSAYYQMRNRGIRTNSHNDLYENQVRIRDIANLDFYCIIPTYNSNDILNYINNKKKNNIIIVQNSDEKNKIKT